jgi:hypothetical protein
MRVEVRNVLQRALIEKRARANGWEIVHERNGTDRQGRPVVFLVIDTGEATRERNANPWPGLPSDDQQPKG